MREQPRAATKRSSARQRALILGTLAWLSLEAAEDIGAAPQAAAAEVSPEKGLATVPVPLTSWTPDAMLPFPSDFYTQPDPASPTGVAVSVPETLWSDAMLRRAPLDGASLRARVNSQDGFSPNVPILVAVPGLLDSAVIPAEEDSASPTGLIQLIHAADGRRIPWKGRLITADDKELRGSLLILHPLERLEHGERYIVIVREGLKTREGQPLQPRPGFREALAAENVEGEGASAWLSGLGARLRAQKLETAELLQAFDFTIQSAENYQAPMLRLAEIIHKRSSDGGYKARGLRTTRVPFKDDTEAGLIVKGHFEVLSFVDDRGRHRAEPEPMRLNFVIRMPEQCPEEGCPVAVFGHGLGTTRFSMFQVADELAAKGIATIGVNTQYHRNHIEPQYVILRSKHNMDLLHGVFLEHVTRNLQLAELVREDLGKRVLREGKDHPDLKLNPNQMVYIGQSMGGIAGVATTALDRGIDAAVFDVAGGGLVDIFFESWVTKVMRLPTFHFPKLSTVESLRLAPLAMYLFDDLDPLGWAPFVTKTPLEGMSPRSVTVQASLGDGLIPNWTSIKLGSAFGLELKRTPAEAKAAAAIQPPTSPGLRFFYASDNFFFAHLALASGGASNAAVDFLSWTISQQNPAQSAALKGAEHADR
jgi:hypothetical protein